MIPDSVTKIGFVAFQDCSALKSVVVPVDCKIEPEAFRGCEKIKIIRK